VKLRKYFKTNSQPNLRKREFVLTNETTTKNELVNVDLPTESNPLTKTLSETPSKETLPSEVNQLPDSPIICNICWDEIQPQDRFVLPCIHTFCKSCLSESIRVNLDNNIKPNFTCPDPTCAHPLSPQIIKNLLDPQNYSRYILFTTGEASLKSNPNLRWCPKPNCSVAQIGDPNDPVGKLICQSPNCGTAFCFQCRLEWHENKSCKQNHRELRRKGKISKADLASLKILENDSSSQQCPNCNLWVFKVEGCDWIKCAFCSHEFCWSCLDPHDHNLSTHKHGPRNAKKRLGKKVLMVGGIVLASPFMLAAAIVAIPFIIGIGSVAACVN